MQGFLAHADQWDTEAEALEETGGQAALARADALRSCAAQAREVVDGERGAAMGVVIVDGTAYPFDLATVTAGQVVWMRTRLGVSPAEMVTRLAVSLAELPEVVALMALSLEQGGETPDLEALAGSVTLSSVVDFQIDNALIDAA